MRPIHQLVHARTRIEARFALMPLEGFPVSRLPSWPNAAVKVLASPRIGADLWLGKGGVAEVVVPGVLAMMIVFGRIRMVMIGQKVTHSGGSRLRGAVDVRPPS